MDSNEYKKFMNYINIKKSTCFKEAEMCYDEFKTDNIPEQIYSKEEVDELFEKFYNEIVKVFTEEIGNVVDSAGSYVQTALTQATNNGVALSVDVNNIENIKAQDSIVKITDKIGGLDNSMKKSVAAKLNPISSGDQAKVQDLQKEVDALRAKNSQLQQDLVKLNKEKNAAPTGGLMGKTENDYMEENNSLQERLDQTSKELDLLKDDMNKKLNESAQFNNLKKMMQQKNDQIKTLRTKLSKYETVE